MRSAWLNVPSPSVAAVDCATASEPFLTDAGRTTVDSGNGEGDDAVLCAMILLLVAAPARLARWPPLQMRAFLFVSARAITAERLPPNQENVASDSYIALPR